MKKALLILNSHAGKMKSKSVLYDMLEVFCRAGYLVSVQITERPGHAVELARDAQEGDYALIICGGGDGTLNEVVTGNMQAKHPLPIGYVPAGSTNDFASSIGLPAKPVDAARLITQGDLLPLDIGLFNRERYFTYIASFGAFTSASYSAPQQVKNRFGHFAYLLEGMKDIPNIKPYHVLVQTQGKQFENDYVFGAVCNTTSVGGVVKLREDIVKMDDGQFEVVLVKKPANAMDLHKIVQALARPDAQLDSDMIDFFQAGEVTITMREAVPWSLDGECVAGMAVNHIKNCRNALWLMR